MSTIINQRIRLAIDTSQMGSINDVITGNTPEFWNGADIQFELGIFRGGALVDITNLSSITVDIKAISDRTGLPVMSQTLTSADFNSGLTLDDWNGGLPDDCHALITFTNEESSLDLDDDSVTFWLVISALTGDVPVHKIVMGATAINVVESGEGVLPPAFVAAPTYYTAAQSDARYLLSIDLTTINTHLATLDSEMTAVTTTANAALPKAGGTMSGSLTITGLSGVLKASTGVVSGSATTSDLTEGSNLYWTQARFNTALAAVKGAVSGVCPLDSSSLIPTAYLPPLSISDVFVVVSQAAMLALSAHQGDVAIRTDINETFILSTNSPSTLGDWKQILTPASAVTSVNSFTGAVTLTTTNIAEGSNLYYTTARAKADALAAALTGFSGATGGTVTSGDSILSALGRLENRTALNDAKLTGSDRVKLDGSTAMTGMLNFTGTTHAGLQLNSLTDTQRGALTAASGMLLWNSTLSLVQYYDGSNWQAVSNGGNGTIWYNGAGAPASTLGSDGSYYLNTSTGDIYLRTSGTWSVAFGYNTTGALLKAGGTMTGDLQYSGTGHYGLRLNNLTNAQMAAVGSPAAGAMIWNTDAALVSVYNGAVWWGTPHIVAEFDYVNHAASNITTTTLFVAPLGYDMYRINVWLDSDGTSAGSLAVNFTWLGGFSTKNLTFTLTDTSSASNFFAGCAAILVAGNITFTTTLTGTAHYNIHIILEKIQ